MTPTLTQSGHSHVGAVQLAGQSQIRLLAHQWTIDRLDEDPCDLRAKGSQPPLHASGSPAIRQGIQDPAEAQAAHNRLDGLRVVPQHDDHIDQSSYDRTL